MIDHELKQCLKDKIQNDEFTADDIPAYLTLLCQIGNHIEQIRVEVDGWDCYVALELTGLGSYWLAMSAGRFTCGDGRLEEPDLLLRLNAAEATRVFSGHEDAQAAFMSGKLKVEGELPDAVRLRDLIEMVIEEVEN